MECDRYGFQYQAKPTPQDDLRRRVLLADGRRGLVDIRGNPFVRFSSNESHSQLYGVSLGEGTAGVGPDREHPFVVRNTRIWDTLWGFRPEVPALFVADMAIDRSRYGIFHSVGDHHAYQGLSIRQTFAAGSGTLATPEDEVRVARDDASPITIVTFVSRAVEGRRVVRGTASDNGLIRRVVVNGCQAHALAPGFAEWEVRVIDPQDGRITAQAEDSSGNFEVVPHLVKLDSDKPR